MTAHKIGTLHQMQGAGTPGLYNPNQQSSNPYIGQQLLNPNANADAVNNLAAAIRDLADVLYHIHTED